MSERLEIETTRGTIVIQECESCGLKRHTERIAECVSCGRWMCDQCARIYHEDTDNPYWVCTDVADCNAVEHGDMLKPITKYCYTCHWRRLQNNECSMTLPDIGEDDKKSYCALPELCDLVTGHPVQTCHSERYDGKVCGRDGKMWELPRLEENFR